MGGYPENHGGEHQSPLRILRSHSGGFHEWPRRGERRILPGPEEILKSAPCLDVLVVDESEAFLASTLHWIESRPDLRLVGIARNAPQALDAVERLCPDLVIVECVLHTIDGFHLTRELKRREDAPLVLLVTFHASAAVR